MNSIIWEVSSEQYEQISKLLSDSKHNEGWNDTEVFSTHHVTLDLCYNDGYYIKGTLYNPFGFILGEYVFNHIDAPLEMEYFNTSTGRSEVLQVVVNVA